jgi:anti-sigma factor RsiW
MNDNPSLAAQPRADAAAHRRTSRPALICRLGLAAALAAAGSLAATGPAPAQSQPQAQPDAPKAPPKRRGISHPPDAAAPSAGSSPVGKSYKGGDEDSVPGGLPGARPKTPSPGGGPANPGG